MTLACAVAAREGEDRQDAGEECHRAGRDQSAVQQQQGPDGAVPAGAGHGGAAGGPSRREAEAHHQKRRLRGKFRNMSI